MFHPLMKGFLSKAIVPILALSIFLLSAALVQASEAPVDAEETYGVEADFVIGVGDLNGPSD